MNEINLPQLLTLCAIFLFLHSANAVDWHVSAQGNDANVGTESATAFRTLQKAADAVNPGDTVLIGEGVYSGGETADNSAVLRLHRSGTADAWITWKPAPGTHPIIQPKSWTGIMITGSYNIIDGLSVIGMNDSIVLLKAQEDALINEKDGKKYSGDPLYNGNGIYVNGRLCSPDAKPHHIILRNCTIGKCPGGGVVGSEMDYLTVEDCLVYENGWFSRFAGSGISTIENWVFDDKPGYHVVIQRNKVWRNSTFVNWHHTGKLSDGNGIILDVTIGANFEGAANPNADASVTAAKTPTPAPTPVKPTRPEWNGRALIANNLSAYNGGSGIHTFRTRHVDIINNTTYWNGANVGYPELFSNRGDDVVILNNIIVPRPGGKVTSNKRNTNNRWDYNIYPVKQDTASKPEDIVTGPHDLVADPLFLRIASDLRDADFYLQSNSPAIDSGTDDLPQLSDLSRANRPVGKARDRGAYEQ